MLFNAVVHVSKIIRITRFSYNRCHLGMEISFPARYYSNTSRLPKSLNNKKKMKTKGRRAVPADPAGVGS